MQPCTSTPLARLQPTIQCHPATLPPSPKHNSGVPPDAFSETGQLWGSPLYDWKAHEAEGFAWWRRRVGRSMQLYDETRIDHFRAFAGYWAVAADAETGAPGWRVLVGWLV